MKPSLSVVVPVFNEEACIDELVDRCIATCDGLDRPYELILVDDGSTDSSRDRIQQKALEYPTRIRAAFLNRNYGQHCAVLCGFETARGELVVTLDADLQNPPEEIARVVAKADEGFDVVGTIRAGRKDSFLRRIASGLVNRMVAGTTGVHMHDYGCMLRSYSRWVVDPILQTGEHSTFVPLLANGFARTTAEIEVAHEERKEGRSKYGPGKLVKLLFDLVTCMTTAPLRVLTIAGGLLSVAGIGFGALLLVLRVFQGPAWAAEGVFTLFAVAFFLMGAQLFGMGLVGEYVGRIAADVKARPRFLVAQRIEPEASSNVLEPLPGKVSVAKNTQKEYHS